MSRPISGSATTPCLPAPRARARVALVAGTLLVHLEGVVDLRLFSVVDSALRAPGAQVRDILIDLTCAERITDSGCGALIALDRLARARAVETAVVSAPAQLTRRIAHLCRSVRWLD